MGGGGVFPGGGGVCPKPNSVLGLDGWSSVLFFFFFLLLKGFNNKIYFKESVARFKSMQRWLVYLVVGEVRSTAIAV